MIILTARMRMLYVCIVTLTYRRILVLVKVECTLPRLTSWLGLCTYMQTLHMLYFSTSYSASTSERQWSVRAVYLIGCIQLQCACACAISSAWRWDGCIAHGDRIAWWENQTVGEWHTAIQWQVPRATSATWLRRN
jgi:hypothetical protein